MGVVQLQPRCPQKVGGVVIDPQPDWSFDTLLAELDVIEKKVAASSSFPLPFAKRESREASSAVSGERRAFVMRLDDIDDVEEDEEEAHEQALVAGKQFTRDDYSISESDDSEDELSEPEDLLMEKVEVVEGALSELTRDYVLSVTEEIRNRVVALETDMLSDNKKLTSALAQAQKHTEARREMDRKLDMQYQRRMAEALDNHLTAVQRSHEHKSQIEERKIRDDAAIEEKRRDKALQEEKLRQEKVRVETEARLAAERKRAEEAEADRRAAKEAAEKIARDDAAKAATTAIAAAKETIMSTTNASSGINQPRDSGTVRVGEVRQGGDVVKCAESALKLEETRLQVYRKVAAENEALGLGSSSAYVSYKQKIFKIIKQTTGTKEGLRKRVDQLGQMFFSPSIPQSITISMFADSVVKVVTAKSAPFAIAHLVAAVTSKVPLSMDFLMAKLNKACIFTIPKYISYSKTVFDTEAAHKKAIGYDDEEDENSYLERMESCMKFYGALVQAEVDGARNTHGLEEGWLWLARFLNSIPANVYTATALHAFLETAGFALFRRYKSQFKKLLNVVNQHFLVALRHQGDDVKRTRLAADIETYIMSNKYLEEPEGRSFANQTDSSKSFAEPEYSEQPYHHQQSYHGQSRGYQAFGSYY